MDAEPCRRQRRVRCRPWARVGNEGASLRNSGKRGCGTAAGAGIFLYHSSERKQRLLAEEGSGKFSSFFGFGGKKAETEFERAHRIQQEKEAAAKEALDR